MLKYLLLSPLIKLMNELLTRITQIPGQYSMGRYVGDIWRSPAKSN